MLNKIMLLFVAFVISGTSVSSQQYFFRVEAGLGSFNMNDLKEFQRSYIPDLGVDIKAISSFPPYWGYGMSVVTVLKSRLGLGLTTELFSTGGRNYYGDYSGEYSFDLLTHAINFGVVTALKSTITSRQTLYIEVSQGVKISSLTLRERLFIVEEIFDESYRFFSTSWWIKPVLRYDFTFTKVISAGAYFGAEINPKSKLHLKENREAFLVDDDMQKVTINWSGVRCGIALSLNLGS